MDAYIVSGATGFIGKRLVKRLIKQNEEVYALIHNNSKRDLAEIVSDKLHIIKYDNNNIEDIKNKIKTQKVKAFINLAWDGVFGDKRTDYRRQLDNICLSADFLMLAKELNVERFIGVSSVSQYESSECINDNEAILAPKCVYSIAKQTSFQLNKCLGQSLSISYVNAVLANVYGEDGPDNQILHHTIINMLNHEKVQFSSGLQMYDFIYVEDAVTGLIALSKQGRANYSYYIGNDEPKELRYFLEIIRDNIDNNIDLGLGLRKEDTLVLPKEVFDNSLLCTHTDFQIEYSYDKAIKMVIDYYRGKINAVKR